MQLPYAFRCVTARASLLLVLALMDHLARLVGRCLLPQPSACWCRCRTSQPNHAGFKSALTVQGATKVMVLREDVAAVQLVADAAAAEQQEGHEQRMEQHQQVTSICFVCFHSCMLDWQSNNQFQFHISSALLGVSKNLVDFVSP